MTKKREICYGLKKSLDPLEMNRYNIMDKKHRKSYRKRYKSRSSFFIKTIGYCWFVDNTKADQEKREHNKKDYNAINIENAIGNQYPINHVIKVKERK